MDMTIVVMTLMAGAYIAGTNAGKENKDLLWLGLGIIGLGIIGLIYQ